MASIHTAQIDGCDSTPMRSHWANCWNSTRLGLTSTGNFAFKSLGSTCGASLHGAETLETWVHAPCMETIRRCPAVSHSLDPEREVHAQ